MIKLSKIATNQYFLLLIHVSLKGFVAFSIIYLTGSMKKNQTNKTDCFVNKVTHLKFKLKV